MSTAIPVQFKSSTHRRAVLGATVDDVVRLALYHWDMFVEMGRWPVSTDVPCPWCGAAMSVHCNDKSDDHRVHRLELVDKAFSDLSRGKFSAEEVRAAITVLVLRAEACLHEQLSEPIYWPLMVRCSRCDQGPGQPCAASPLTSQIPAAKVGLLHHGERRSLLRRLEHEFAQAKATVLPWER